MHDRVAGSRPPALPPRPRRREGPSRLRWLLAGAAVLAGSAAINLVRTSAAERANPPPGKFIEVDGVRVHYVEHGAEHTETLPIVLLHGNGAMVQDFELSGIVEPLAAKHRVILFDRPGSGYTERPRGESWTAERQAALLVAAATQLGIERPVVVGHSWGTLTALAWALDHPEQVSALVLASGYYYKTLRPDALSMLPALMPVLGDIYRYTLSPILGRLTLPLGNRLIFSPSTPTRPYTRGFPYELALRPSQIGAILADTAQMPVNAGRLAERYGALTLPIVVIVGDGDRLVDPGAHSERFAAAVPQAELTVLEGAGHMIQHIAPTRFVAAVMRAVALAA